MKSILSAVIGATLALSAIEADAQATPGERQVSLTIETDTLASALDKWAQQSGFQIFVQDWEAAKKLSAPSLKGIFTAQGALEQLLSGTPLTYVWINDKAVSIRKKVAQTVPAALQRTGFEVEQSIPVAKFSGDDGAAPYAPAESVGDADVSSRIERLEEVIVTGTYIRGAPPVGSPLRVYGRDEIDRSGAATLEQFARRMTENFSGVDSTANPNSSAVRFSNLQSANVFAGSAFNLRGIGPSSTLTLFNGNRLAAAGLTGAITDISQVPVSAIDRIEVVADGASAIYGADAVAGVVNIITRTDFDGAETSASYGAADDGGGSQLVASQVFGTSWNSGNFLLNYEYSDQDDLDASQREYLPDQGGALSLIPENRKNSAFLAFRQSAGERTTLSGNAFYGDRDTSMQQHQQNLFYVLDSRQSSAVKQTGASLALERSIVEDWSMTMNGTYSRMQQEAVGEQTVDVSGDTLTESEANSKVYGLDMLVNGSLADLAAGDLKTAFGASVREERFESLVVSSASGFVSSNPVPEASRRVTSFFGELRVPVLGSLSQASQRMQLSGAVRYDDYDDVGSKVNSKFGVAWLPIEGFQLRATYGTSFRAPLLTELNQPIIPYVVPYPNPLSPTGVTNTVIVDGGNETLRPERAKSFTAGFDLRPQGIPRLAVALTYFNIDFRDRITIAPVTGNPFTNPIAAPYITLNPPLTDVEAWFTHPGFLGDFTGEGPGAVSAIWDSRRTNIASTDESGIDLTTTYGLETGVGNFAFTLSAERLLKNDYEVASGVPAVELLNTFAQPPKLKGRGDVSWTQRGLQAALSINYVNSYTNGLGASPGVAGSPQTIESWTTADLYFGYVTADSGGFFGDMTLGLCISNVTDEQPPFVEIPVALTLPAENVLPFDAANASPIGRYISFRVTKRW